MDSTNLPELLDDRAIARMAGRAPTWMTSLRARGEGPPVVRLGHRTVRYRRDDVETWLATRCGAPRSARTLLAA